MNGNQAQFLNSVRHDNISELFFWDTKEKIGAGSYATVYKAQRRSDGQLCAVKVIASERIRHDRCWRQLAHEIAILRSLDHPSCIRFLDAFISGNEVNIVLELVEGGELFNVIAKRGALTEREAAQVGRQLLGALAYLHTDKGIVHRDLKPENILVNQRTFQIKLIDFGFSKFIAKQQEGMTLQSPGAAAALRNALTVMGPNVPASTPILDTPKGSVRYMAPEILDNIITNGIRPRVTTRDDIKKLDMFAAGVILFVMLGGKFPFRCSQTARPIDQSKMLLPQICEGVTFQGDSWGMVSPGAKDLCQRLLVPDATQRMSAEQALRHQWIQHWDQSPVNQIQFKLQDVSRDMYDQLRAEDSKSEIAPVYVNPTTVEVSPAQTVDHGALPETAPPAVMFKPKPKRQSLPQV